MLPELESLYASALQFSTLHTPLLSDFGLHLGWYSGFHPEKLFRGGEDCMRKHAKVVGSGGMPPRKISNFDGCRLPLRLLFGQTILAKIF